MIDRLLNGKEFNMLQLVILLFAAPAMAGPPDRVNLRDRLEGPTPVTDKWIIPPKAPDCKNAQQEQVAIEQIRNGELGQCFVRDQSKLHQR